MSNGAYAGLRLAARAAKPDPEADPNETEPDNDEDDAPPAGKKKKAKEKPMDENCNAEAVAQARADERARFMTVLACDHYAGRESLALSMLGNDKLSADEIVGFLGASTAAPAAAAAAAATTTTAAAADGGEQAALAEMQAALAETQNSNIEAGAAPAVSAANADAVWNQALANSNFMQAPAR